MALTLLLAACGGGGGEGGEGGEDAAAATAGAAGNTAGGTPRSGEDSVAAVLQTPDTVLASLRFVLPERPVVGQPFALQLLLQSKTAVPALQVTAEAEGLTATPATATIALDTPELPVTHALTLRAEAAGLTELLVRLRGGEGTAETVYAVPVLVTEVTPAP